VQQQLVGYQYVLRTDVRLTPATWAKALSPTTRTAPQ
jgi:hypothetical protein